MTSLEAQAQDFAAELTKVLNGTVTVDASVTVFLVRDADRALVAPGENVSSITSAELVPLNRDSDPEERAKGPLFLSVGFDVALDESGRYLSVQSSTFGLCVKKSTRRQPIRVEYDRDARRKQPAHLQIDGASTSLGAAYALAGGELKAVQKLHFPLGRRRFRPSLEDFIEFLIQEGLVTDPHPTWRDAIRDGRKHWLRSQTKATVRRNPEAAAEQLREMGYGVEEPDD